MNGHLKETEKLLTREHSYLDWIDQNRNSISYLLATSTQTLFRTEVTTVIDF